MTIPIVYFRSSSFNCHRFCPQQHMVEYILGIRGPSNKKADKGTICHKILEICALCKLAIQKGEKIVKDNDIGDVLTDKYDPEYLNDIISRVYMFYTSRITHHTWDEKDFKDCKKWVWKALEYNEGMFDPMNRDVVAAEPHFDFELPFDWAEYDYTVEGERLQGHLALKGTIDLIMDCGDGVYEICDWKGLPLDTPLPTAKGWSTMEDISVGDLVFDKDGQLTKVLAKSQPSMKPCYKIKFDDTSTVICDKDHLWTLEDNSVVNVLDLKVKDNISTAKPLDLNEVDLPIDPYVFGLWLGDGRNRGGEITSSDEFVFEEIMRRGYNVGDNIGGKDRCVSKTVHKITPLLRQLNVINNKHIPLMYLRSSHSQRLDLLRGLMDSDGGANPYRHQAVFTNCNRILSDNVKELLLSLGQRPNQCKTTQKGFGLAVNAYPLHFRPININPFLLPRKADRIDPSWGPGKSNKRQIRSITKIKNMITQCILVDSPTNTYLCTKDMIPTHNTGKRLDWATGATKDQHSLFSDAQLRIYHYAAHHLYPEAKTFIVTIYFINYGGAFTVHFQDSDLEKTEEMLRKRFEAIKNTERPALIREKDMKQTWKCRKLCHAGMTTFEDTHVEPIEEHRFGQVSRYKQPMTKCEQIKYMIEQHGIEWVTEHYKHPEHIHGFYQEPGSVE